MDRPPDIEISAAARVDEVLEDVGRLAVDLQPRQRFAERPVVRVAARADVAAAAEVTRRRPGLPDAVEPCVTYRDVAVAWRLTARITDP